MGKGMPMNMPMHETPAPADTTLDADIAAFIAENGDDIATTDPPADTDTETPAEGDSEPEPESDTDTDEDEPTDPVDGDPDGEPSDGEPATPLDTKAIAKAIEDEDPVAFVKALGEHAEKLLTGKAHKALRLQVKAVEDAAKKADEAQGKAEQLATKLSQKYGDPIAARKAAEKGDVDSFVDMVEKWAGHDWNTVLRWVTNGMAGRKERLEEKQRETSEVDAMEAAKQEQAQAEVRAWCDQGVKSLAPDLHMPEVVDMVQEEIRKGFSAGITTPAKALPLVRKRMQEQYEKLHKVFGDGQKPRKKTDSPAARSQRATGTRSRETTIDEDIAAIKREAGLR